jgi:hypothetical protein
MNRGLFTLALFLPTLLAQQAAKKTSAGGLPDILAHVRAQRDAADFRATGRLVRVLAEGERKSFNISIKAHAFADAIKILCEVTDPPAARVRLLIESAPAGKGRILEGHPGDAAPKALPTTRWGDGLLDSDFSFEDLMENQLLWRRQTLVEEAPCGARTCYVVRSEPAPEDNSSYSRVTTWLAQDIYFPVKVEKIVKASGAVKEFTYFDLRQSKGIWSATQIEAKLQSKPGSTLLIVNRGAEKANLTEAAFDPALLIRSN